jgi:hypothetical protein
MKLSTSLSCLLGALLACAGCGNKEQTPSANQISGVQVDMPKLGSTFEAASPELRSPIIEAGSNLRYGQYAKALASLSPLTNNASLTDQQKKVLNEVIDQIKQVIEKSGPSR